MNLHIDDYYLDNNNFKLYLRGWLFAQNYKISIIADNEQLLLAEPNEIRMDITTKFSNADDTAKYGFEYILDLKKKYQKIKIQVVIDEKAKTIFTQGFTSSKVINLMKKTHRIIIKIFRVLVKQNVKLFNPRMFKNYVSIICSCLSKKSVSDNYVDPNNSFQYRFWQPKTQEKEVELKYKPLISVVVPVYNVPIIYLKECIDSVINQTYKNWELCIADDCSTNIKIREVLDKYTKKDKRIKVVYRKTNGHISQCTNSALKLATGDFISLLDNDDILSSDALYEVAKSLNENKNLDIIYSDEDKLDLNNNKCFPTYKPDWSPDIFYCYNYFCHFTTIRKKIIDKIGGFRVGYEGSQDYDLFLRVLENTKKDRIFHIPKILYHWRMIPGSTAETIDNKSYAFDRGKKALQEHMSKLKYDCIIKKVANIPYYYPKYKLSNKKTVGIIIDKIDSTTNLKKCIKSILSNINYKNFDILINGDINKKYLKYKNIKKINEENINTFIEKSNYDLIMIINCNVEFTKKSNVKEMLSFAIQKHVGIVSGTMTKNSNYIQYSGTVLFENKLKYANTNLSLKNFGYLGRLKLPTNYLCPGLDVIIFERKKYLKIKDNVQIDLDNIDDYIKCCLEFDKSYYNLVLPNNVFILYNFSSIDIDLKKNKIKNDKYYNDNLSEKYLYKLDK